MELHLFWTWQASLSRSEKQRYCVERSSVGPQHPEERWELNCSPSQHHKLSSHCLGPVPGSGVIAAVWHCGEYFAFLLSQGSLSFPPHPPHAHCNLPLIKTCLQQRCFHCRSETMRVCACLCVSGRRVKEYLPTIRNPMK